MRFARFRFLRTRKPIARSCVLASLLAAAPARADIVVLDNRDCTDWTCTTDAIVWKQKGSALAPRSLLKFDITDLGSVQLVNQATLHLFIERGYPGATIEVYHVHDDTWSYPYTDSGQLYNWPAMELIASVAAAESATVAIDVTPQLIEDLADGVLSVKLHSTPEFAAVRVASPLAPRWAFAPRLRVDFETSDPEPLPPDLTLSTGDIAFSPMQPLPGSLVVVTARVRNNSATASTPATVEFWNGPPGVAGSSLIDAASLPALAPGGGATVAQTSWSNVPRGLHDVYVVVDAADAVAEIDETNNIDSRPFLVSSQYESFFESFEYAGRNEYFTDFDFPPEFNAPVPKPAFFERSGAVSCHGDYHLEAILDGTADDGTVWIERALPAEPWSSYSVQCDWREFRYHPDMAFPAVVAIGVLDPEVEADFTFLGIPVGSGCGAWSFNKTVDTGPYDHVWVAIGFSITWETPGVLGLDSVSVELKEVTDVGVERPPRPLLLSGPVPNPTPAGTDFLVVLPARARVEVTVYDVQGRLVRRLFDGYDGPGEKRFHWDARTSSGTRAAQGVYFVAISADGKTLGNGKVVIVR